MSMTISPKTLKFFEFKGKQHALANVVATFEFVIGKIFCGQVTKIFVVSLGKTSKMIRQLINNVLDIKVCNKRICGKIACNNAVVLIFCCRGYCLSDFSVWI